MLPDLRTPVPGPRSRAQLARLKRYEARTVTFAADDFPIFWDRAEGTNVWDVDGNRYLDVTCGFAVTGLGHNAPSIVGALADQAGRLVHAMGDVHPTESKAALCEALSAITFERWGLGTGKTLLATSGFEAVEAALKTALLATGKPGVISFTGGYHGLGYGALEVTQMGAFRAPFRRQLGKFSVHLPYPYCYRCPHGCRDGYRLEGGAFPNCSSPCLEAIADSIEREIAKREIGAILVEPVQGRGGDIVPPRDFLPLLRQICDAHKILLIADEIYTGFNRTGRLFACEHFGIVPDLICLGKGLTSGFPLSACVGRADVMDAWPESTGEALHTSTFLGHPIGCAMAVVAIKEHLKTETQNAVRQTGRVLDAALAGIQSPRIGNVRGIGLMRGIELVKPEDGTPDPDFAGYLVTAALQRGLIVLAGGCHGNVLSLTPVFAMSEAEVNFVTGILKELIASLPS